MIISKRFALGVTQYQLDFVDIDTTKDLKLFIDPHFLSSRSDPWSVDAIASVQNFFQTFIDLVQGGDLAAARDLFSHLGEPNETCLGLSKGAPRGRGAGEHVADEIFDSLTQSKAVKTGLLQDIEDARIFVNGVGKDITSDITTVLIRGQLLRYTIEQCNNWGIPMTSGVPSGDVWDRALSNWSAILTDRLIIDGKPILLVPKGIASYSNRYSAAKYHQHFLLTFLKNEHLRMNTVLVQRRRRKDGSERVWVTKKSVEKHEAPLEKDYLVDFTRKHSAVFEGFKEYTARAEESLPNEAFTEVKLEDVAGHMISALKNTPSGNDYASQYHRLVMGILELIFYPALSGPRKEEKMHDGRKRADIVFDNAAKDGFFHILHDVHGIACQYIFVECKNYSRQIGNPELDQLAGRFGVNKGQFGLLVSRNTSDLDDLIDRCADTLKDGRGLMIPLTDDDLSEMLEKAIAGEKNVYEQLLANRQRLISLR